MTGSVALLAVLTAAALPLAPAAAPAVARAATAAGEPGLSFSADGSTWTSGPLDIVPASWRPVPGSAFDATFSVRNDRSTAASVALFATDVSSSSRDLLLATSIAGGGDAPQQLGEVTGCLALASARLAPGEVIPVTLSLAVSPGLSTAQNTAVSFEVVSTASDAMTAPPASTCPVASAPAPSVSALPRTGWFDGDTLRTVLLAGLGALGAGAVLSVRRREHHR
ncbi:MAG: hypothetical protein J0I33_07290 [Microbacterium ginsengisoli]|jgi:hypothetical protein|uniref:hypothetical protein n=1 Tax=Microbacterium TaxID=33882 RepID=UPI0006F81AD6|nr:MULTISPECIES: hypothetical protein [unclassified Microbacterium]MBN9198427.1 hypothetical protein [Microbacterium ginsengisoli]KQR95778.1 hypothetical protein ASG00_13860 [Microbacterium sp. Leaf351]KQR99098.1 hypothetical protein ASF93_12610 [Microbacterium sp. Leaf347]ODU78070.1 MAG: hypothetical protein ABT08_04930 [Microbacterium sp. SCN 71-21]OJU78166.1 MAG: hypothetical protein BGO15_02945 [Microbacterium sp. 71-23]